MGACFRFGSNISPHNGLEHRSNPSQDSVNGVSNALSLLIGVRTLSNALDSVNAVRALLALALHSLFPFQVRFLFAQDLFSL
jgi:hypothetical protein